MAKSISLSETLMRLVRSLSKSFVTGSVHRDMISSGKHKDHVASKDRVASRIV